MTLKTGDLIESISAMSWGKQGKILRFSKKKNQVRVKWEVHWDGSKIHNCDSTYISLKNIKKIEEYKNVNK